MSLEARLRRLEKLMLKHENYYKAMEILKQLNETESGDDRIIDLLIQLYQLNHKNRHFHYSN